MGVYDSAGGGGIHIDVALTDISVGWPNDGFVGEALFPVVRVKKQSDKYYVWGHEGWSVEPAGDLRGPGTVANEIPGIKVSLNPYFAQEHSLQIPIPDEERENSDSPFDPDRDGTELVTSKVLLQREVSMRDIVQTTANYPASHVLTLSGTAQWNDYGATSDPIGNFKNAIRMIRSKLFVVPNLAVIPWEVMSYLEDHPDFIERIKYAQPGIITADIISSMIGIDRIIVPGLGIDTANPGQANNLSYLWGKDVLIAYVPRRAGLRIPAFAYEFVWTYGGRVQIVDRWREQKRKSDLIRVSRRYDLKMIAEDANGKSIAGFLIKNAIA